MERDIERGPAIWGMGAGMAIAALGSMMGMFALGFPDYFRGETTVDHIIMIAACVLDGGLALLAILFGLHLSACSFCTAIGFSNGRHALEALWKRFFW